VKKQDADRLIEGYIRKLYGFAVSKCGNIDEAEELAGEIVLTVYQTLLARNEIVNVNAYIYKIAHNVWIRYLDRNHRYVSVDGIEYLPDAQDQAAAFADSEIAGILRREITYLSGIQRNIIILHYFHDKKVRQIADMLSLPSNTVKWHLACARKELNEGMEKTRVTGSLGVQPIRFANMGHNGHPGKMGDTADFLAKSLTQNIAYLAYHTPKTINEIAEELGVNPIFVKDEVDVLEEYGFLDLLPGGKYRTNIYITEMTIETAEKIHTLEETYAEQFAAYFVSALEKVCEIPAYMTVPDDDLNLLKWTLVPFLSHQLGTAKVSDEKYSVKRKDGGDYVAHADVDVTLDLPFDDSIYWYCGDMWRDKQYEGPFTWDKRAVIWQAWQMNCHWTDRPLEWRDNLWTDYDKVYEFLNGRLPADECHYSDYQRLLDKGYLLKDGDNYKCNLILCRDREKWYDWYKSLLPVTEELLTISKSFAQQLAEAEIVNQPPHMHALVRYYAQNKACALHTRIMKCLLDRNVLKLPMPEQAKGLCTVLFLL